MKVNIKRYALYLVRWQLSTPILAPVLAWLGSFGFWVGAIVANLIGGLIFFWVDRFIFNSDKLSAQWEIIDNVSCSDCETVARGYRLVKTTNYDRSKDVLPKFRCEACSVRKTEILRMEGVSV